MAVKSKAIIFDLDGTLCNNDHRQHLITGEIKRWDVFSDGLIYDTPNAWCVELIQAMKSAHYRIVFVTGRMETHRRQTENWLKEHLDMLINVDYKLFMRATGDYKADDIIKKDIYNEVIQPMYDVTFVVDDRKRVVLMWRSIGLTVLHCAEGDF